jgi:hypothetical protein
MLLCFYKGCFLKFSMEVGVEESIVNEPDVLKTPTTQKVRLDLNSSSTPRLKRLIFQTVY